MTTTVVIPSTMSYDGTTHTYTDDSDPTTGLDGGGHVDRFVPAMKDVVAVTNYAVSYIDDNTTLSKEWATKVTGEVISTEGYAAKAWAIGGTGIDTISGSAKDWASKLSVTVGNTSDYSAKQYALNAADSASESAQSATAAANSATTLTATSTTSTLIATGSKTFTTQANKQFQAGQTLKIVSQANSANFMVANVTSYSTTSLTVNVTSIGGSGTLADWNISVSGIKGDVGANGSVNIGATTNITGIIKGAAGALSAATAGTDYQIPITGGATTIATSNLTTSKALVSDASGKVAASTATSTELGYLSGVTSGLQAQLNAKQATLVSGTNISSINGTSLLLGGNLTVTASGVNSGGATNINGLFKGNGSNVSVATAGTDYAGISTANSFAQAQTIQGVTFGSAAANASNIAIGSTNLSLNSASSNTAVGYNAGRDLTTGGSCTALGSGALNTATTNNYCTAIGSYALTGITAGYANCTGLGYYAQVTAANQIQLGDSTTTTYVYGTVQNRSDIRDKADIRDTVLGLDFINALRPVDYRWDMREYYRTASSESLNNAIKDGAKKRNRYHHGLIAQEVQSVIAATGVDFGGFQDHSLSDGDDVLSLGYDELIAPLIKAVQELSARVVELEAKL